MLIRTLKSSEKERILRIGRTIFREEDEIPLLKKALENCSPSLSFVAVDEEHIAGFSLVCREMTTFHCNKINTPKYYELSFLGISPGYQGRGLGSRLLKETLVAIFQKSKTFTCWLLVDTINKAAISLYEKFGFRHWSTIQSTLPGHIMYLEHFCLNCPVSNIIKCTPECITSYQKHIPHIVAQQKIALK
jgi:ribosomal protein S18 acetylase RimI-like enzyme